MTTKRSIARSSIAGAWLMLVAAAGAHAATPKSPEIDEVIVTASPLREAGLEIAQPTTVLSGDRLIQRRGASLGETLASVPGVSGTWFGPQASRPVIRGQSGERVKVYEDGGESLDVAALSNDHAVTIDPLIADRIEVLHGPSTLLYGNGASAGVVNIVSGRIPLSAPDAPALGAFEIRGDTGIEERGYAMKAAGGSDRWAFHVDAFKRDTGDVRVPDFALSSALRDSGEVSEEEIEASRGKIPNSASDSRGGAIGLSRVGEQGFVGLSVSRFETTYGIPGPKEEAEEEETSLAAAATQDAGVSIAMEQTRYDLGSEWRTPFDGIDAIRLRATYNDYEHAEREPSGEIGTQFDQSGVDARLNFDHAPIAGWRGTFGAQYRDIDFAATGEEAYVPPSATQNLGIFMVEERTFGRATIELGVRYEQQEVTPDTDAEAYDSSFANVAGGLIWRFTDTVRGVINLTSSRRHPTATELYADGPHLAVRRFEIGDADLSEERASTIDLSLRRRGERLSFTLTAYAADYSDYIYANPTADTEDGLPVVKFTQADARFTGFEAELELPPLILAGGALATRLIADYTRGKLDSGSDLPQIPPLRAGAQWRYTRGAFSAGLGAIFHAEQDDIAANELPTDSYTLVDADVAIRTPVGDGSLLVYLRGDNLLDRDARRHTSPLKEFAPLPGRSLGFGLRFEF